MFKQIKTEIEILLDPILNKVAAEIIELNIKKINNTIYLQIIIDKETGGISIEECAIVNRELSYKLKDSAIKDKVYTIEVSSPGVGRPLRTSKDFKRVIGRHVSILTSEDNLNTPKTYEGIIKEVSEDKIIILPIKKDKKQKIITAEAVTIMIKNITKANETI